MLYDVFIRRKKLVCSLILNANSFCYGPYSVAIARRKMLHVVESFNEWVGRGGG